MFFPLFKPNNKHHSKSSKKRKLPTFSWKLPNSYKKVTYFLKQTDIFRAAGFLLFCARVIMAFAGGRRSMSAVVKSLPSGACTCLIKSLLFQKIVVSLQRIKPVHLICYMLSYCTIKETDKGIGNANPLFFCLGKYPIYRFRLHQYLTNQVYSQQT